MLPRHARLGVVQAQGHGEQVFILLAARRGKEFAESLHRRGIRATVEGEQVLGLLLQLANVGTRGNAFHGHLRASSADDPQSRLHKRRQWEMEASGFNPSRGPGCVLHAAAS